MAKISIRLKTFIIIASFTTLTIISSCATSSDSSQIGEKMTTVRQIFPSAIEMVEIRQGVLFSERPDEAKITEVKGDSGLLGYCVESKVVGRSGPFKIRVLLDPQLYVKRAFTSQFDGKGPNDPIQVGKDIDAITGATISSQAMTNGVRDIVKLVKLIKKGQDSHQ